jgi:hypothetical protein
MEGLPVFESYDYELSEFCWVQAIENLKKEAMEVK